jgi:AraC family transcriptional regulator
MRSPIEKATWFIESHFARDVTLDELAGVCGLSRFQMSRLFSHATGMSMTAYVRGRRLTEAVRALASGAPISSPLHLSPATAPMRLSHAPSAPQFGLTPGEVRARASLAGFPLVEPLREDPKVRVHLPPPRFETAGPLLIAGLGRRFAINDFAGIPALWQEFHLHLNAIPSRKGSATYGVVARVAAGGDSYFYLAGVEVSDFSDLDPEFTGVRLPAQRWAVFVQQGHITMMVSTVNAVLAQALPAASPTAGHMPDLLERYDRKF